MSVSSGNSIFVKEEWIDEVVYISSGEEEEDVIIELDDEDEEDYRGFPEQIPTIKEQQGFYINNSNNNNNNNSNNNNSNSNNNNKSSNEDTVALNERNCYQNDNNGQVVPGGYQAVKKIREPIGSLMTMQDHWDDDSDDTLSGNEDIDDFTDESWIPQRANQKPDADEKLRECHWCGFKCSKLYTLNAHMKSSAPCAKPYACNLCDSRFKKAHLLKSHILIHIGEYSCDTCDFITSNIPDLKTHMSIHSGEMHECYICDRSFRRAKHLTRHLTSHKKRRRVSNVRA